MSTTTTALGRQSAASAIPKSRGGPRRSMPHLVLGLLLVSSCTAVAVFWSLHVGDRRAALALAHAVTVGQTIQPDDLREVSVALDGVDAIPAGDTGSVVGQTAAASLPAGVLLARGMFGTTRLPADDHGIVALALQPGHVPLDISPGAHVVVVLAADQDTANAEASDWPGVVVSASELENGAGLVVSVELGDGDARRVAAAPTDRLSVVLVPGGDR